MQATCQCGAVKFQLPAAGQPKVLHCHCSQCRQQSSSAFGTTAIFEDFHLPVSTQPIGVWTRETYNHGYVKDCYFCLKCGVRLVHRTRGVNEPREDQESEQAEAKYELKPGRRISVKGGCIENLDWSKGVHIFCGDAVTNLEFPDELEKYVEEYGGEKWEGRKVVQRSEVA